MLFRSRTRAACRQERYSSSTEERYLYWVRRFLNQREVSAPGDLQGASVRAFLGTLRECTYPTRKQARNALRFLFDKVLVGPVGSDVVSPKEAARTRGSAGLRMAVSAEAEALSALPERTVPEGGPVSAVHPQGGASAQQGVAGRVRH